MYGDWAANAAAVAATVAAVALSVMLHYEGLRWLAARDVAAVGLMGRRAVLKMIFGLLLLHVAEIWVFGMACWGLLRFDGLSSIAGAHAVGLLDAVYLSAITFTTVGFGDLSPVGPLRLLAGTEALTGLMLITWSASFTYLEMARHWRER
jgi:hypothetical protein